MPVFSGQGLSDAEWREQMRPDANRGLISPTPSELIGRRAIPDPHCNRRGVGHRACGRVCESSHVSQTGVTPFAATLDSTDYDTVRESPAGTAFPRRSPSPFRLRCQHFMLRASDLTG